METVCVMSNLIIEVIIVAIKIKRDTFYTHIFCLYKYFKSYQSIKRLSINDSPMHFVTHTFFFLMYISNLNNDCCFTNHTIVSFYTYRLEFLNDGVRAYTHTHTHTHTHTWSQIAVDLFKHFVILNIEPREFFRWHKRSHTCGAQHILVDVGLDQPLRCQLNW
jgi:hypothetical protein